MSNSHTSMTVSGAAVVDLVALCQRYSLITSRELHDLHVPTDLAEHLTQRIPYSSYRELCKRLSGSRHAVGLGLRLGQTINPNAKGLLASWVSQCRNLGEALNVFCSNISLMNPAERWQIESKPELSQCTLVFGHEIGYPILAIERSMSAMVAWGRTLSGVDFPVQAASFSFSAPSDTSAFRAIFGDNLQFDASSNALLVDQRYLDLPVLSSNHFLKNALQEQAERTLFELEQHASFSERVCALLEDALRHEQWLGIDQIAQYLCMSRQSLYRHLKSEGTSFVQLSEALRQRHAKQKLRVANPNISAIALQLGYRDSSSFHKAFKRWFGQTPLEYVQTLS